jgi:beta-lactamase superfamily II metal-dependent hydrolase
MTHFELDALAAGKGDALVLRWGTKDQSSLALIDGGPSTVWDNAIQPHLHDLAGIDPAGQPNPVVLELVVVSHVDDDHIAGIIDLANAIDSAQKQARRAPATVGEVWHNAFADMQFLADFADEPELQQAIKDADQTPKSLDVDSAVPRDDPTIGDITAGAQSVAQGRQLDRVLKTINVNRNTSFFDRGDFVREGAGLNLKGLHITVLAPNTKLLNQLKREWKKELKKILKKEADKKKARVSALAAAFDDPSIPNQSSIVLLVEFKGKKMLLTGDVRGDQLIDALQNSPAITTTPLKVDLLKVPHHGSAHSNGRELFEAVTADHYVISGNGEHGNPHPDTLKTLFETQKGRPITLHLTNRPTSGAVRPADVKKAKAAQEVLDAAQSDPNVTIIYRDDGDLAVTVDLT